MEDNQHAKEEPHVKGYQTLPGCLPHMHTEGPGEREARYRAYTERLRCERE